MNTNIKEQLVKAISSIKKKIKLIQNEEHATELKFKKVFKPITDPLETLIKVKGTEIPDLNVSRNTNTIDTAMDLDTSIEYEKFRDIIRADSSKHSEYYDLDDEKEKNLQNHDNDTLLSLKKEDVLNIYDKINVPFGIRSENNKLMMGNVAVSLSLTNNANKEKKYMVSVRNKNYELTAGLKELIMRNKPNLELVSDHDKTVYKEMLINTNAHKRDFNPDGQLKGDKGIKYRQIIKPLFSQPDDATQDSPEQFPKLKVGSSLTHLKKIKIQPDGVNFNFSDHFPKLKVGGSLPDLKTYKSNTDYVYWDDPNELIERLKLLIASKSAGNSNHDNEIVSIIEELREAGIIKK